MINLSLKCILKIVFIGSLILGNSWSQWRKTGLSADVTAIATIPGAILAGTSNQGIFSSSDNGIRWTARSSGLPTTSYNYNYRILSIVANQNYVFAGTDYGGIFRATQNVITWVAVNNGLPEDPSIFCIAICNSEIYASVQNRYLSGLFISKDNGDSWFHPNDGLKDCWILSLAVNGSDMYAATYQHGIFKLKDKGTSWDAINVGLPANCNFGPILTCENTLYTAAGSSGIFVSTNNGASWSAANNGLNNMSIKAFTSYGSVVFAGTWYEGKVFFSCNKGKRWAPLDTAGTISNWGTNNINTLGVFGKTLYAGTNFTGLMQLSLDSIPDAIYTSNKSRSTYKIPVSGDSLNYGYTLLDAPTDMCVSPGGTIAWSPKNDSSYITQVDYLVIDDNGKRDTSSILVFVNEAFQASNKQVLPNIKYHTGISITQNPGSRNCIINLPGNSFKSDIYIYNLAGRIIDKFAGNNGTSILWQPRTIVQGSYILLVKNGVEQWTKQFVIR